MTISRSTWGASTTTGFGGWTLIRGDFNMSISGTSWVGTIVVQRRFATGGGTLSVDSFTTNTEITGFEPEDEVYYRVGLIPSHTSGKPIIRLSQ